MAEMTQFFPAHKCGLYLEHNPNRDYYESVAQWLKTQEDFGGEPLFPDASERTKAIETNEIWILQWYPDTPVGSYRVAAASLDRCLSFASTVGQS